MVSVLRLHPLEPGKQCNNVARRLTISKAPLTIVIFDRSDTARKIRLRVFT